MEFGAFSCPWGGGGVPDLRGPRHLLRGNEAGPSRLARVEADHSLRRELLDEARSPRLCEIEAGGGGEEE